VGDDADVAKVVDVGHGGKRSEVRVQGSYLRFGGDYM
jgi:hypothetical protein